MRSLFLAASFIAVLLSGEARAEYRETVPALRIGILGGHPAAADPARLDVMRQAYAKALGIAVEIASFRNLAALIDAHASGRVQYALHSAVSYATTEAVCGCVRAIRRAVSSSGAIGFRSVLLVREGAPSDISRLKVAYSNEDSVSGWQIPQLAIASGSLPRPQFLRAGSVRAAVDRFAGGTVDGIFAWIPESVGAGPATGPDHVFGGLFAGEFGKGPPFHVIWQSEPVLHGPHAVHDSLPDDLVEALGAFLDDMPQSAPDLLDIVEPLHSGGFVPATPEEYRSVRGLAGFSAASEGSAAEDATR